MTEKLMSHPDNINILVHQMLTNLLLEEVNSGDIL